MQRYGLNEFERGTKDRKLLYTVTRSDTYRALGQAACGHEPVRVADRLYYSELVYPAIVGRTCEFSPIEQGYIERVIEGIAMPTIVCMIPLNLARSNACKDEQMDGVNDNYDDIYHRYLELLDHERFPEHALVYDYTSSDKDEVWDYIDTYMTERRARSWA